jgi:5-formyltetrahydrofolate cyclo-ligase
MHSERSLEKDAQRQAGISARKSLERETAKSYSAAISARLMNSAAFEKSNTILTYQAYGGEADPSEAIACALALGKRVAWPICREDSIRVAAVPETDESWEVGRHGIRAPVENLSTILCPGEIDLVIVPCTAFNGHAHTRIGMGGGYYDRFLPMCANAVCITIAFEVQQQENLCVDKWDVPLNAIITEDNWY